MDKLDIIAFLPYQKPFLFVDDIQKIDENGVVGTYTFNESDYFYQGHFLNNPITPGVILAECMAQIGVVCLGIYILGKENMTKNLKIGFSNMNIDFLKPVLPGEKIMVTSNKIYFRFNKLKCDVKMTNVKNELICSGEISGMFGVNK